MIGLVCIRAATGGKTEVLSGFFKIELGGKGQFFSKGLFGYLDSPKKQTNEFVFSTQTGTLNKKNFWLAYLLG